MEQGPQQICNKTFIFIALSTKLPVFYPFLPSGKEFQDDDTLFRSTDRAVVVKPNSPRAAEAEDIAAEIACHAASSEAAPTIAAGLETARRLAGREGIVCAAGSLYMIGEARRLVVV